MNSKEAAKVLESVMVQFRAKAWGDLRLLVEKGVVLKNTHYEEIEAPSGTVYQVRVNVYWDNTRREHLRVCGAIDDGGWRAIVPVTDSFIVDPAGKFVGE